jgi:hypothetical protein
MYLLVDRVLVIELISIYYLKHAFTQQGNICSEGSDYKRKDNMLKVCEDHFTQYNRKETYRKCRTRMRPMFRSLDDLTRYTTNSRSNRHFVMIMLVVAVRSIGVGQEIEKLR